MALVLADDDRSFFCFFGSFDCNIYFRVQMPSGFEHVTANKEHASEVLPFLSHLEIERTWAGIMPFSKDGKPIIGKLEAMAKLKNNTLVPHRIAASA